MSSKKTNGDEQCKCRLSSLSPHRKKKCALFGKKGILLSPDALIQNAIALDKEKEDELDQSPEAMKERIERAVTEAVSPGTTVRVIVTVETANAALPPPPTESTEHDEVEVLNDESASTEESSVSPIPPPAASEESEVAVAVASLSISASAETQVTEHDFYVNSPVQSPEDDLLGGLMFETNPPGDKDEDEDEEEEQSGANESQARVEPEPETAI